MDIVLEALIEKKESLIAKMDEAIALRQRQLGMKPTNGTAPPPEDPTFLPIEPHKGRKWTMAELTKELDGMGESDKVKTEKMRIYLDKFCGGNAKVPQAAAHLFEAGSKLGTTLKKTKGNLNRKVAQNPDIFCHVIDRRVTEEALKGLPNPSVREKAVNDFNEWWQKTADPSLNRQVVEGSIRDIKGYRNPKINPTLMGTVELWTVTAWKKQAKN